MRRTKNMTTALVALAVAGAAAVGVALIVGSEIGRTVLGV
jgi:hypothetical protein